MAAAAATIAQRWVAIRRDASQLLSTPELGVPETASRSVAGLLDDFMGGLAASRAEPLSSVRDAQRKFVGALQAAGIDVPGSLRPFAPPAAFATQFDDGFEGLIGPGYLRGVRSRDADEISVTGVAGVPLSVEAVVVIAESVLTSVRQRPERPVLVVVDEGEVRADMDESRSLSEYLVHLARVLAWARSQAVAVNVWLYGGVTAATYAACAATASHVVAFPNAMLLVEGSAQVEGNDAVSGRQWVSVGLVDECADVGTRVGIAWNASP